MVHLVIKKRGDKEYLYVQECVWEDGRPRTKHIAYLGRKTDLTKKNIQAALRHYGDKKTRRKKWKR